MVVFATIKNSTEDIAMSRGCKKNGEPYAPRTPTSTYRARAAACTPIITLDKPHAIALGWLMCEHGFSKTEAVRYAIMQAGIEGLQSAIVSNP